MRLNPFEDQLMESEKWQERILPRLEGLMKVKSVEVINNPQMQRNGIDIVWFQEKAKIDLKVRSYWTHKFNDILLEIEVNGNLGWFYTTKSDFIAYVWKNESGTNLIDGYLIHITPKLRKWVYQNKHKFKQPRPAKSIRKETGAEWQTKNLAVPISEFPKGSIYRFNPYLDTTDQSSLDELLGGLNQ